MKATFEVTTTEVAGKPVHLYHNIRFETGPNDLIVPGSRLEAIINDGKVLTVVGNGKPISSAPRKVTPRKKPQARVANVPNRSIMHSVGGKNAPRWGGLGITEDDFLKIERAVLEMDGALSPFERAVLRHYFGIGGLTPTPLKKIAPLLKTDTWRMTPTLRKALRNLGIKLKRRRRLTATRSGGQKGERQMELRMGGDRREGYIG